MARRMRISENFAICARRGIARARRDAQAWGTEGGGYNLWQFFSFEVNTALEIEERAYKREYDKVFQKRIDSLSAEEFEVLAESAEYYHLNADGREKYRTRNKIADLEARVTELEAQLSA